jgi:hypothetical protein
LGPILEEHLAWPKLYSILSTGIIYPLLPISEMDRLECLDFNLQHRNYPTFNQLSKDKLTNFIDNKLSRGFIIPILIEKVPSIPNTEAYPIYIVVQNTIDEEGNKKTKYCSYYDLSYSPKHMKNLSINAYHLEEEIYAIQYAFTL